MPKYTTTVTYNCIKTIEHEVEAADEEEAYDVAMEWATQEWDANSEYDDVTGEVEVDDIEEVEETKAA